MFSLISVMNSVNVSKLSAYYSFLLCKRFTNNWESSGYAFPTLRWSGMIVSFGWIFSICFGPCTIPYSLCVDQFLCIWMLVCGSISLITLCWCVNPITAKLFLHLFDYSIIESFHLCTLRFKAQKNYGYGNLYTILDFFKFFDITYSHFSVVVPCFL